MFKFISEFFSRSDNTETAEQPTTSLVPRRSGLIEAIAEHFRTGDLEKSNIDTCGISNMSIIHNGIRVYVSWFRTGHVYEMIIDGTRGGCFGMDAEYISKAAQARAKRLVSDKLRELEKRAAG